MVLLIYRQVRNLKVRWDGAPAIIRTCKLCLNPGGKVVSGARIQRRARICIHESSVALSPSCSCRVVSTAGSMHFTLAFGATVEDRVLIGGANQTNFGHTRASSRDGKMAPHHNQLVCDTRVSLVVLLLHEDGVPCSQSFPLLGFPGTH